MSSYNRNSNIKDTSSSRNHNNNSNNNNRTDNTNSALATTSNVSLIATPTIAIATNHNDIPVSTDAVAAKNLSNITNSSIAISNKRERAYSISSTRKRFAGCALIEIIHLHDCLRGALYKIDMDVQTLVDSASSIGNSTTYSSAGNLSANQKPFELHIAADLSNSVASRFHLIWSVFQAHSGAEDEFIWPALKMKLESKKSSSTATTNYDGNNNNEKNSSSPKCGCEASLEQEEYEEDHAVEETMFKQIHTTLRRLNGSFRYYHANVTRNKGDHNATNSSTSTAPAVSTAATIPSATTSGIKNRTDEQSCLKIIKNVIYQLKEQTTNLTQHLLQHLEKEETQCLPMVQKHLSMDEISTLVGNIMGQRSADVMSKILNLSVCSLPADEREDMVQHMKKAMVGTFFEKWLTMGGWLDLDKSGNSNNSDETNRSSANSSRDGHNQQNNNNSSSSSDMGRMNSSKRSLDSMDSYYSVNLPATKKIARHHLDSRLRHPSRYYVKEKDQITLVWNSMDDKNPTKSHINIPQFTQSELTPTYHFSETKGGLVLGCEHYMRECKLRHPTTGELYTCRLCCEEIRQSHRHSDEVLPQLDRYNVTEVLCMKCGSLQPAGKVCVNTECESNIKSKPFAANYCSICHLYDDSGTSIYHCPFCNVCRKGKGLGIDFRHCMRCNACVSISEKHKCISQRLMGNCPICHETMFESTEPLRGLKCGHVMHLSCFNEYLARATLGKLTCPLCKLSFDNMRG